MEFANQMPNSPNHELTLMAAMRVAKKSDAPAITRLLNSTRFTHYHVDWRLPVDWLGDPGFLVLPLVDDVKPGKHLPSLLWSHDEILACLVVTQDPAGNVKPDKAKATQRIDGAVAMIMALDRATRHSDNDKSIYEERGPLIF